MANLQKYHQLAASICAGFGPQVSSHLRSNLFYCLIVSNILTSPHPITTLWYN
jgi:hypothetical protein